MEMRGLDKIREKVEIRLDNRQIAWLITGSVAIAAGVFAAGYLVGSQARPAPETVAAAPERGQRDPSAQLASIAHGAAPAPAAAPNAASPVAEDKARYTYHDTLNRPSAQAQLDDPTWRLVSQALEDKKAEEAKKSAEKEAKAQAAAEASREEPSDAPSVPAEPKVPAPVATSAFEGKRLGGDATDDFAPAADPPTNAGKPGSAAAERPPAPKADEPKAPKVVPQGASPNGYTVQVRAFRDEQEATKFVAVLKEQGHKAFVTAAEVPGKGRFFRVRIGKFKTIDEATRFQQSFDTSEGMQTIVTPL